MLILHRGESFDPTADDAALRGHLAEFGIVTRQAAC